jgi:hypothetical protein
MTTNVGTVDRVVRIVVGVALLSAMFFVEVPLAWLGLIGIVPVVTGFFGYCPLYAVFGFDTCPLDKRTT